MLVLGRARRAHVPDFPELIGTCVRCCPERVEQLATPPVGHAAAIVVVISPYFYLTTERLRDGTVHLKLKVCSRDKGGD